MATRGRIGIELKDGSILSIYSHWDNSPEYNGRILRTYYNTRDKVESLIDGGDISSLWTDKDWDGNEWGDCKYRALTYAMRGEKVPSVKDKNLEDFLKRTEESWGEYAYVFVNDEWVCYADGKKVEIPEPKVAVAA